MIERINRYAAELPKDEPIAVCRSEVKELAAHITGLTRYPTPEGVAHIEQAILSGTMLYRGHKLRVI